MARNLSKELVDNKCLVCFCSAQYARATCEEIVFVVVVALLAHVA